MSETETFTQNLELLKKKAAADLIPVISGITEIKEQPWSFCKTGPFQQTNLKRIIQDQEHYLHSPENISAEASQWLNGIDIAFKDVIVIYGIGLGYYYEAAKEWLHANPKRKLIFVEDDLFVLRQFLHLEIATTILKDPQVDVYVHHIKFSTDQDVIDLVTDLLFKRTEVTALRDYLIRKRSTYSFLQFQCQFLKQWRETENLEYLDSGRPYFSNFFRNASKLPSAYFASSMKDYFKGIPAIICGAGPSLKKHLGILKEYSDRALVFAGGSSMNVLNGNMLMPHFGIGLDPFPTQFTRLVTNTAYETPFFYTNRMNSKALEMIHGPKLYVSNSGAYNAGPWLESKLEMDSQWVDAGANVVNFSVGLAEFLGCNPIILIGVDLAYTEGDSYAPGIATHAIHNAKETMITKNDFEEVIQRNDIYGKPVNTLWKWVSESFWFTFFAGSHPNIKIINSTEGGIGFDKIENIPLKEAADKYLTKEWDIQGMVHAVIQQNPMPPKVTSENIRDAIEEVRVSLHDIILLLEKHQIEKDDSPKFDDELKKLTAYKAVLQNLDEKVNEFANVILSASINEEESIYAFPTRIQFLNETIQHVLRYIQLAQSYANIQKILRPIKQTHPLSENDGGYKVEGNQFSIEDKNLNIHFKGTLSNDPINQAHEVWNGKLTLLSPDKKLLMEQYYTQGKLHGPSIGYGKNEQEVSRTWFIDGIRQGKALFNYDNGQLYSQEQYKDGVKEGEQVYFYPDGNLKSIIPFNKGKLDGVVKLYYPTGILMREIHFADNKRQGKDDIWSSSGSVWIQSEYVLDSPKGSAKEWYENGKVFKEITYGIDGEIANEKQWTPQGQEIALAENAKGDYFEKFSMEAELLTQSIEGVLTKVNELSELLKGTQLSDEEMDDFNQLKDQIAKLREANQLMLDLAQGTDETNREMIWKSPLAREAIQKQTGAIAEKLRFAFTKMQSQVQHLKKYFKPQGSSDNGA